MSLPISVVVPHTKSRAWFFERYTLPSIRANDPSSIIVEDQAGGACAKRNSGAAKAKEPFVIFVDDDTVLGGDCLRRMLSELEENPSAGYAYSGYTGIVLPGVRHPMGGNFLHGSGPFDVDRLRRENYIDTTSLMRTSVFPGFDPALERLQDWDLWLTLLNRGIRGRFISEILFMKFNVDEGITARVAIKASGEIIKRKHHLK